MNNLEENLVKVIAFWKSSVKNDQLFPRTAESQVDILKDEIVAVMGPRRSGKSSFLKLLMQKLPEDSWLYVNFEDPFFIEENEVGVIEKLIDTYLEYFSSELKYLFFDEIQNIGKWEKAIRKYQETKKYKIFVTGSSSQLLSKEFSTVLTGRHKTIRILPLSFKEYLEFNNVVAERKTDYITKEGQIKKLFKQYLIMGGFPKVAIDKKPEVLKQYFYDIIEKDIMGRYQIRQGEKLERLTSYLLSNVARVYSVSALSKTFDLSWEYISLYIQYLKEAFVLNDLTQFSYSLKTQEKSQNKIYSIDNGLVTAVSFSFSENLGSMLENAASSHFFNSFNEVYYYKTKSNSELDFVLKNEEKIIALVQICADLTSPDTKQRETKALLEGSRELSCETLIVATLDFQGSEKIDGKDIIYVPLYKILLGLYPIE